MKKNIIFLTVLLAVVMVFTLACSNPAGGGIGKIGGEATEGTVGVAKKIALTFTNYEDLGYYEYAFTIKLYASPDLDAAGNPLDDFVAEVVQSPISETQLGPVALIKNRVPWTGSGDYYVYITSMTKDFLWMEDSHFSLTPVSFTDEITPITTQFQD
jgi:hypothetical protein